MGWTAPRDWISGEVVTKAMMDPHVRDNLKYLKANVAWDSAVELTIAAGVVTKTQSHNTVDTEGGAGTDDLVTINGCSEGELFLLRAAHTDRTVVLKHGTGNIELPNGQDYSMDTTEKAVLCFYHGSKVLVVGIVGIAPHATTHQNAGTDEISVVGLSGELADVQPPKAHKDNHDPEDGSDPLDAAAPVDIGTANSESSTHELARAGHVHDHPDALHKTGGGRVLYVPRTYSWFISGTVAVGTEQRQTYRMKRATTVEDVELHVKTAPTGAALIVDINEAGTTLFSTNPEIDDAGTVEDDNHAFSDTALAAGAELTLDIDQVGSGTAGADLTVLLHCKEAVI